MENSIKILIVDDDETLAELLKKLLGDAYVIDVCYTLNSALEVYDGKRHDIIITDLNIGGDSGFILAKYIKAVDEFAEILIITGHASIETSKKAIDLGVVSYLTKPIDATCFKSIIKRLSISRLFNKRSLQILHSNIDKEHKAHIGNIVKINMITTKINQAVDLETTVRVLLKELTSIDEECVALLISNCLGYKEVYSYSSKYKCNDEELIIKAIEENWLPHYNNSTLSLEEIKRGEYNLYPLTNYSEVPLSHYAHSSTLYLISYGETFGVVILFFPEGKEGYITKQLEEFLLVLSPFVTPYIFRGYTDKRTIAQAQIDGLTGVANRAALDKAIIRDMQTSYRYSRPMALIMMDIDNFKEVNDTYGHLVGDEVLKDLTSCVRSVIRGSDFIGRYGGEEFIVILPDTDSIGALQISERIRAVIDEKICVSDDVEVDYTVSVGVANYHCTIDECGDGIIWETEKTSLIKRADDALYQAKRNGKNCVVVSE